MYCPWGGHMILYISLPWKIWLKEVLVMFMQNLWLCAHWVTCICDYNIDISIIVSFLIVIFVSHVDLSFYLIRKVMFLQQTFLSLYGLQNLWSWSALRLCPEGLCVLKGLGRSVCEVCMVFVASNLKDLSTQTNSNHSTLYLCVSGHRWHSCQWCLRCAYYMIDSRYKHPPAVIHMYNLSHFSSE